MEELFEQAKSIIRGIWLNKRYIVLISWLICIGGWITVSSLPDQYQASARVYVNTQSLLKPLLRGLTIGNNPQQRVRLMVKTLLSRPNLEKILRMVDLDILANNQQEFEELIKQLADNINIRATARENLFTITYRGTDPAKASQVVKAVLKVFVENTVGQSRDDSKTAKNFLEQQILEYEERLADSEQKLTNFKQKNGHLIIGNGTGYYSILKNYSQQLETAQLTLKEKTSQLVSAKAQLAGEQPSFGLLNRTTEFKISTEYDNRITSLQEGLDQLSLKYTEQHPDVKEIKQRISTLQKLQQQDIDKVLTASQSNNIQGQLPLDQNPVFQEMKLSVVNLQNEIIAIKVRVENYENKVKSLKSKIHLVPEIEAQLTGLSRGYHITKQKYEEMLNRRESALLSEKADLSVDDIQFKVIDPPRAKEKAIGPNRPLLYSTVLLIAVGGSVAIAFLLSQLNAVVLTPFQLSQLTGYPVLGSVSTAGTLIHGNNNRTKNIAFIVLLSLLFLFYISIMAYEVSDSFMPILKSVTQGALS